jgi:hypothetical protein
VLPVLPPVILGRTPVVIIVIPPSGGRSGEEELANGSQAALGRVLEKGRVARIFDCPRGLGGLQQNVEKEAVEAHREAVRVPPFCWLPVGTAASPRVVFARRPNVDQLAQVRLPDSIQAGLLERVQVRNGGSYGSLLCRGGRHHAMIIKKVTSTTVNEDHE